MRSSSNRRAAMHGRVVVVTGASAGVGRATAHRFARAGAVLALVARDAEALEVVKGEVEAAGSRAIAVPADVADGSAMMAIGELIERDLGPIEVWVNAAMVTVFAPLAETTPEEFHRVTEVTYLGYVYGTMAALRHMRPRNRGTIVQVGSSLAYRGIPLQAAYCGAKHAIRGFTESLRAELLHERSRVRVTMVQLPGINTPQFDWARAHIEHTPRPVPPLLQPEVAADAIFGAARAPAREYWLGLSTARVILANMIAPGLLDHYLARMGYEAQQTKEPLPPDRRDNLREPVRGLHRTRGSFDAEAGSSAMAMTGRTARIAAGSIGLGIAAAAGAVLGYCGRGLERRRVPPPRPTGVLKALGLGRR